MHDHARGVEGTDRAMTEHRARARNTKLHQQFVEYVEPTAEQDEVLIRSLREENRQLRYAARMVLDDVARRDADALQESVPILEGML